SADQGLPRGGNRGRRAEGAAHRRGPWIRRGGGLQADGRLCRQVDRVVPARRGLLLRQCRGQHYGRRLPRDEPVRPHRRLRQDVGPRALSALCRAAVRYHRCTMGARTEIPPGSLYMLILKTLARLGPMHGYGIAEYIQQISEEVLTVEEGSLYPALQRMLIK